MAAFNFPSLPIINQVYAANGIVWRYDGSRWVNTSATSVTEEQAIIIATGLAIVFA